MAGATDRPLDKQIARPRRQGLLAIVLLEFEWNKSVTRVVEAQHGHGDLAREVGKHRVSTWRACIRRGVEPAYPRVELRRGNPQPRVDFKSDVAGAQCSPCGCARWR